MVNDGTVGKQQLVLGSQRTQGKWEAEETELHHGNAPLNASFITVSAENEVGAENLYIASLARAIRATVTMSSFCASPSLSGFSRWQIFEKLEKIHSSTPNITPVANFSTGHIDLNLESIVRIARARIRLNLSRAETERRSTQYSRSALSRSYLVGTKSFNRLFFL